VIVTEILFTPYTYQMNRMIGDVNLPDGAGEGMELAVFIRTDEGVTGCCVAWVVRRRHCPPSLILLLELIPALCGAPGTG